MYQETRDQIAGFLIWVTAVIVIVAVVVIAGRCLGSPKNPDPPPTPEPQVILLQPVVIDRTLTLDTLTVVVVDRTCVTSPRYSPELLCLDENGDVILP